MSVYGPAVQFRRVSRVVQSEAGYVVEISVAYYLGIDGGGSKTLCAVGDEATTLASATAGPSNITRTGRESARESIQQAIRLACRAARVNPWEIQSACIGAAGAARKEIASVVRRFVGEVVAGHIKVVGDMEIALEAAFGLGPGVIVIAGTGSIAYGRDARGNTARAGGWGFAISDEGSAHWIGRQAVSSLLRAADERGDQNRAVKECEEVSGTLLLRELKPLRNVRSLEQLAAVANSGPDFAAFFPGVLAAAEGGDGLAGEILREAAAELARLAASVVRRLSSKESALPIAMAGGVFRHSQQVRRCFAERIRRGCAGALLHREVVEPVDGALQMARRGKS